jgi:hypothetical protein
MVPVFNYAPHHKAISVSGSVAPRILNLSTRRLLGLTPWQLTPGKGPLEPENRRLGEPHSRLKCCRKVHEIEYRFPVLQHTAMLLYRLSYPGPSYFYSVPFALSETSSGLKLTERSINQTNAQKNYVRSWSQFVNTLQKFRNCKVVSSRSLVSITQWGILCPLLCSKRYCVDQTTYRNDIKRGTAWNRTDVDEIYVGWPEMKTWFARLVGCKNTILNDLEKWDVEWIDENAEQQDTCSHFLTQGVS